MVDWLTGYAYRAKIPISATSAGAQTNYQKKITLIKGSGSNSAGTIYLNNHALNWPYDIRFTKADGSTLLDFYREEYDSTDGTWHVEIDSIASSGETDIYVYYGKASDSDASSGAKTFIFFDDFESGNLTKWYSAGSYWSAQSVLAKEGTYAAKGAYGTTWDDRMLYGNLPNTKSILIRMYLRQSALDGAFYPMIIFSTKSMVYGLITNWGNFDFSDGSWKYLPVQTYCNADQWYLIELALDLESGLFRWWIDGDSKGTSTLKDGNGTALSTSDSFYGLSAITSDDGADINGFLDQVWVRKYIYPEPAWASPSTEEGQAVRKMNYFNRIRRQ